MDPRQAELLRLCRENAKGSRIETLIEMANEIVLHAPTMGHEIVTLYVPGGRVEFHLESLRCPTCGRER